MRNEVSYINFDNLHIVLQSNTRNEKTIQTTLHAKCVATSA